MRTGDPRFAVMSLSCKELEWSRPDDEPAGRGPFGPGVTLEG